MILDSLANLEIYRALGSRIGAGLDFITRFDPATEVGRYPIDGEDLFAMVQRYETAPSTEKRFETHRRYIDIQAVIAGRERMLYAPVESLQIETTYRTEKDVTFYAEPAASSSFLVLPGHFAIFYPADGHKPGCMAGGRDAVTKIVVKVAL